MQFEVIKSIQDFKSIKNEWNLLFDKIHTCSIFQSFIFNYISWKEMFSHSSSNSLFIIKIIEDNAMIGVLPLYNDSKNTLRFINDIHCDFCDIILSKEINLSVLFYSLIHDYKQTKIKLINIRKNSIIYSFGLDNNFSNIIFFPSEYFTSFQVKEGNYPDNYDKLLCRERGEIRRIIKKNSNCEHIILNKSNCDFPIDDILILRNKMISHGIRNNNFLTRNHLKLIQILYNNDLIEISCIRDKQIRALLFVMKNKDYNLYWIDVYDNNTYTATLYNYIAYIKSKSLISQICINLGRGDYNWKIKKFRPEIHELYTLNIFSNIFLKINYIIKSFILSKIKSIYIKFK